MVVLLVHSSMPFPSNTRLYIHVGSAYLPSPTGSRLAGPITQPTIAPITRPYQGPDMDVWAHNQEAEQARILTLVHACPIVAVATSHDVPARRPPPPAATAGTLRADPRRLSVALRAACAIESLPDGGVLVTRDGAEDVAYVVRHFRGGALPPGREYFLRACNAAFPELYDLKVMAEWTTTVAGEPPLAAAAGRDAFRRLLALVRARRHGGGVLKGYNAFLPGLGAADTIELMSIKTRAEEAERLRQMKELFHELCLGQDPAFLDRLPLC